MKAAKTTKKPAPKKTATRTIDPLYVIFEQHLMSFSDADSDRKAFLENVVTDYLSYLRKNNIIVPKTLEQPIIEELSAQVNTMLVKKIYGFLSITDYQDTIPTTAKKKARTRYHKIGAEKKTG